MSASGWWWFLWAPLIAFAVLALVSWLHDMEETFGPIQEANRRSLEILRLEQEARLAELRERIQGREGT